MPEHEVFQEQTLVYSTPSCKAQWKGEEHKADRGRGGKTISENGQAWRSASPRGQWRTGKKWRKLVLNHLWYPTTLVAKRQMMMMMMMMMSLQ